MYVYSALKSVLYYADKVNKMKGNIISELVLWREVIFKIP